MIWYDKQIEKKVVSCSDMSLLVYFNSDMQKLTD